MGRNKNDGHDDDNGDHGDSDDDESDRVAIVKALMTRVTMTMQKRSSTGGDTGRGAGRQQQKKERVESG